MKPRSVFATCATLMGLIAFLLAAPTPAGAADKVNYRLKWLFNSSVVGDLYADVHGFFERAGLDVTVKSGGPERDAIRSSSWVMPSSEWPRPTRSSAPWTRGRRWW